MSSRYGFKKPQPYDPDEWKRNAREKIRRIEEDHGNLIQDIIDDYSNVHNLVAEKVMSDLMGSGITFNALQDIPLADDFHTPRSRWKVKGNVWVGPGCLYSTGPTPRELNRVLSRETGLTIYTFGTHTGTYKGWAPDRSAPYHSYSSGILTGKYQNGVGYYFEQIDHATKRFRRS